MCPDKREGAPRISRRRLMSPTMAWQRGAFCHPKCSLGKRDREKLMLGSLPEVSARLLDLVRDHGRLTIRACRCWAQCAAAGIANQWQRQQALQSVLRNTRNG